eukprot:jgi/Botrbrau1/13063/Bobra.0187s0025.1
MGSFGARSTAEQVAGSTDLSGKAAVVTGGNSGIGEETARVLAKAGARVILTSRSAANAEAIAKKLKDAGCKGEVVGKQLDLGDRGSISTFVDEVKGEPRIDYLILNAGIMSMALQNDKNGWESQIGTNHYGHFALVQGLLPKLKQQKQPSRIVVVSSRLHEKGQIDLDDLHFTKGRPFAGFAGYNQSKLANVLFAKELARRLEGTPVSVYSLHPGVIPTNLARTLPWYVRTGLSWLGPVIYGFKSIPQGAATTVYAALSPDLEGKSGAYLDDCAVAKAAPAAEDAQLAKKLWDLTEKEVAAAL